MKKISIFIFLIYNVAFSQLPEISDGKEWVLVENLSDEFEGNNLDTSKWQSEPVGNDWNWDGRPPGLFKSENVTLKDGKLNVTVGKLEQPVNSKGKTFIYQGGIVRSLFPGKVGCYFEAKMKANQTVMSSTFWLMTKYDCEKKQELDIQECVGRITDKTEDWAKEWDQIFHSNAIHRTTTCNPESKRVQKQIRPNTKNHEAFYVYGAWWKSPTEILFYLDGKYAYTLNPTIEWDMPAFIQMAIETYDWNPVPEDGGLVVHGTWEQRTTQYEWVRTWEIE
ncbi:beta-porphyranase B (GH16) [Formosa agariphila KMM 3901]|uniref:Beta-porphyranase B (GH16) n=1 Tax=Formosa agariphila (strain DSM 15362 / KCTC 12365 / LMG 23005 / KMM 3901 / M-2Alg 35-1) TaxID=1347342 RepID=T2KN47_FORAG|nr:glycosyl hydrolase [Formosa agariphila]CDF79851.1 beta-porphyranase B (GH16) [Formosa agariphila KMM 3901]